MADKTSTKKGILKKKKAKITVIPELMSDLKAAEKSLKTLADKLNALMNGDGTDPYWNGENATKFFKKAVANQSNNIEDYKNAYNAANAVCLAVEAAFKEK